jgi:hypothetical protein
LFNRVAIETCQPMMDLYQAQVRSYIECLKGENSSIIETFNYLVVIRVDIDPDTEPTSATTKPPR